MLDKYLTWFKSHERLLIVLAVAGLIAYGVNRYINYSAEKARLEASVAQQVLQAQKDQNAQLAAQLVQQAAQYQVLVTQLTAQNQSLLAAISARNAATQKQQQVDSTLPLPALGVRWSELLNVPPGMIIPEGSSGFLVSEDATRRTVIQLELIPSLQADVKDDQTIIANKDTQISSLAALNSGLNKQVGGLNTQIVDADVACKKELSAVKAEARRSKKNWLLWGVGIGVTVAKLVFHF